VSFCRVSQKDSYTEHTLSCVLSPVKLRDKKIRKKGNRDRGTKTGGYKGSQFVEPHLVHVEGDLCSFGE
jgi:hypothetical protein